jgi:hypothetical protein
MGQVGGFVNGQAHATIRVIFWVVEHEVMEGAVPMGCGTLLLHEWACGPTPRISTINVLGSLEEILSAPQNPPSAAIRSKRLFTADKYDHCVGQVRSDSGAPESVVLLLT